MVLLGAVIYLLLTIPKADLHLWLNCAHTPGADLFFRYYSPLAEWPLYILMAILLAFKKWRPVAIYYASCEIVAAIVVQIIKHIFRAPRPVVFFDQFPDVHLPLVEGVTMHHSNSFPSGHTNTFFVFFTCWALLLAYRWARTQHATALQRTLQALCLVMFVGLAALGGYARIYLSQHFLLDVCVGSIIGVTVPVILYVWNPKNLLPR